MSLKGQKESQPPLPVLPSMPASISGLTCYMSLSQAGSKHTVPEQPSSKSLEPGISKEVSLLVTLPHPHRQERCLYLVALQKMLL